MSAWGTLVGFFFHPADRKSPSAPRPAILGLSPKGSCEYVPCAPLSFPHGSCQQSVAVSSRAGRLHFSFSTRLYLKLPSGGSCQPLWG